MKSFKIRENQVELDGILYGQSPTELKVRGEFIDSTIKVTDDSTGIVEKNAIVKSKRKPKSK